MTSDNGMPPDINDFDKMNNNELPEDSGPEPPEQAGPPLKGDPREFPSYEANAAAVLAAIESYFWPEWVDHRVDPVTIGYKVLLGRPGDIKSIVVGIPFRPDADGGPPPVEKIHEFLAQSCEFLLQGSK